MRNTHLITAVAGTAIVPTAGAVTLDALTDDTKWIEREERSSTAFDPFEAGPSRGRHQDGARGATR